SMLDNIIHLRRELVPHLDAEDAARKMPNDVKRRAAGQLTDLEYNVVVDRGRIIGLWDWDGIAGELVWATFAKASKEARAAADELARYVQKDLGAVRSFSLDSPESRGERLDALRAARF